MDTIWMLALCVLGVVVVGIIAARIYRPRSDRLPRSSRHLARKTRSLDTGHDPGSSTVAHRRYRQEHYPPEDEMALRPTEDDMERIADAMAVTVEYARYIFESVGPVNAEEIVRGLAVDRETERAVLEAARTDEHWWRPHKEWWEP